MVSITVSSSRRLNIIHTWILSFYLYQVVMGLTVCVPSGEDHVYLWLLQCGYIVCLIIRFFDMAEFITLTPLWLAIPCKLPFPTVALIIPSVPAFALEPPNKVFTWYSGNWLSICILSWCMYICNNNITPTTSQCYIQHPIIKKPYPLNW